MISSRYIRGCIFYIWWGSDQPQWNGRWRTARNTESHVCPISPLIGCFWPDKNRHMCMSEPTFYHLEYLEHSWGVSWRIGMWCIGQYKLLTCPTILQLNVLDSAVKTRRPIRLVNSSLLRTGRWQKTVLPQDMEKSMVVSSSSHLKSRSM